MAAPPADRWEAAREEFFAPRIRQTGFNYTGALSIGNVVDMTRIGLALHNVDWEAQAVRALNGWPQQDTSDQYSVTRVADTWLTRMRDT